MIEPVVVGLRLVQYLGAMLLMGASLFFLYCDGTTGSGGDKLSRQRRLLVIASASLLALASLAAIAAQSSLFAGSVADGLDLEALRAVGFGMDIGKAALVRSAAAVFAMAMVMLLPPGRVSWIATASLGAVATASLAWMGHAAAGEGFSGGIHLISDIVHVLAAGTWIGALFGFLELLLAWPRTSDERGALHSALHRFSGTGSLLVALLVATGLVNSWVLVGPDRIDALWATPYGQLLTLKLGIFAAMLGLAAVNRFHHVPDLGQAVGNNACAPQAIARLRRSIALETIAGVAILFLVAWFGTMEPPVAI